MLRVLGGSGVHKGCYRVLLDDSIRVHTVWCQGLQLVVWALGLIRGIIAIVGFLQRARGVQTGS